MTWPPINPPIHPSTHKLMHPLIGGGVSTDFKSSNRIKISQLVQILLYFYWFGAPTLPGGEGWVEWVSWGFEIMWGPSRWCGDDGDDMGRCGDDVEMTGDDMGTTGTTCGRPWTPQGQHVETTETTETTDHGDHMGTFWGLWGWCGDDNGDDMGTTGMMWGPQGQCGNYGDNKITKNTITFGRIEIIEFRLKIWDPWTLLHTCRLHLMCRWGMSYPKWHFYAKSAPVTLEKKIFLFLHWIPLDHI